MIIYNTTFNIENEILTACVEYLKTVYIPQAAANGCLHTPYLRRVLREEVEDTTSYSVQFYVRDVETLTAWLTDEGRALQQRLVARFGAKIVGFSTLLEEIPLDV